MIFLINILAIFFALNMGGASFAASFAAPYGSKILSRERSCFLFLVFVLLGSVIFGQNVSITIGENVVPSHLINHKVLIVIFLSAGFSMFLSNLMSIPQSTSLVTVAAIAGAGTYLKALNVKTILYFLPFWLLLPIASYFLTLKMAQSIYPPRKSNFWIYEKFVNQQGRLRNFVVLVSCYSAFSVGTNNVANVAGPLASSGILTLTLALFLFGIFYGFGSFSFMGPIKTAGNQIVPLGLLTASIISFVSGSLMLIASGLGVPQSFVMLQMGAIFAISTVKEGFEITFNNPIAQKTFYTWTINPFLTYLFSIFLCWVIVR